MQKKYNKQNFMPAHSLSVEQALQFYTEIKSPFFTMYIQLQLCYETDEWC